MTAGDVALGVLLVASIGLGCAGLVIAAFLLADRLTRRRRPEVVIPAGFDRWRVGGGWLWYCLSCGSLVGDTALHKHEGAAP